jgi:hypothetical protein
VTEEACDWFQAAAVRLFGSIGLGAGDILLNRQLERRLRLRTLHGDASNVNVWSHAWVYRERSQIIDMDIAFIAFGRAVIEQFFRIQIVRSRTTEWNKLEGNYIGIS